MENKELKNKIKELDFDKLRVKILTAIQDINKNDGLEKQYYICFLWIANIIKFVKNIFFILMMNLMILILLIIKKITY